MHGSRDLMFEPSPRCGVSIVVRVLLVGNVANNWVGTSASSSEEDVRLKLAVLDGSRMSKPVG